MPGNYLHFDQVKDFYDAETGGRQGQTSFQSIEDLIYAEPFRQKMIRTCLSRSGFEKPM